MSYAQDRNLNPYAAPKSKIAVDDFARRNQYAGYGGFWRRAVAYIIDIILMAILGVLFGFVSETVVGPDANDRTTLTGMLIRLISVMISVAYYAGLESSSSQATLGKMAMGLQAVDLYGQRISFGKAVGRLFCKGISALILCIGFIMVAFTERKQGLHDMLVGTLVVQTR